VLLYRLRGAATELVIDLEAYGAAPVVYVRRGTCDGAEEIACVTGAPLSLALDGLTAADLYVFVDTDEAGGRFDIAFTERP
jgi:hypothetical protein